MQEKFIKIVTVVSGIMIASFLVYSLYEKYGNTPSLAAERWALAVTNAYSTQNKKIVTEKEVTVDQEKELRVLANEIANTMTYGYAEIKVSAREENSNYSHVTLAFTHEVNPDPYCEILKATYAEMVCYDLLQVTTYRSDLSVYFIPTQITLKNAGSEYQFDIDSEGRITKNLISRRWL